MDEQARKVLDTLEALAPAPGSHRDDDRWLANFRYQTALLRNFGSVAMPISSVAITTLGGVAVRVYRPGATTTRILFHIHGGGGIAGSLDGHDPMLRLLAARTGWTVVAPDYRLAPEYPFPAPLDDCYAALDAVRADHSDCPIVVSGDSIGGTLATALAMMARDRQGPSLAGQILLYPNTDLRRGADYPSRRSEDGNIIAITDLERQIDLYLGRDVDRSDPLVSPLLAEDLTGLPPALILTCACDPLRDEGEAFADRLADAAVATEHRRIPGMIHAFLQMVGVIDATETAYGIIARWLDDTGLAAATAEEFA